MYSIAIVGGDGSGKTSVARKLVQSFPYPTKYLYMGLSTHSSNIALPTSRLVLFLKRRSYRKMVQKEGGTPAENISSHLIDYEKKKSGPIRLAGRFINRLAEAWYRQITSMIYQLRGYIVVYDRHFLFETAPGDISSESEEQEFFARLYYWIMSHTYPNPDLPIFLDAPGEVLFKRKGESTPEYLDARRKAYLDQGKKMNNFVRIDATQPLEKVFKDVEKCLFEFHSSRSRKTLEGDS